MGKTNSNLSGAFTVILRRAPLKASTSSREQARPQGAAVTGFPSTANDSSSDATGVSPPRAATSTGPPGTAARPIEHPSLVLRQHECLVVTRQRKLQSATGSPRVSVVSDPSASEPEPEAITKAAPASPTKSRAATAESRIQARRGIA